MHEGKSMNGAGKSTSKLAIAIAWIVVTIPLGWGVYQSVVKSLPLLHLSGSK